ncbi:hypothetical protein NQZ68_002931 [Dissostichus eleginoides]|nr:hypothetical protein NQZ68_002931 [Dissostichus eleginoides]
MTRSAASSPVKEPCDMMIPQHPTLLLHLLPDRLSRQLGYHLPPYPPLPLLPLCMCPACAVVTVQDDIRSPSEVVYCQNTNSVNPLLSGLRAFGTVTVGARLLLCGAGRLSAPEATAADPQQRGLGLGKEGQGAPQGGAVTTD